MQELQQINTRLNMYTPILFNPELVLKEMIDKSKRNYEEKKHGGYNIPVFSNSQFASTKSLSTVKSYQMTDLAQKYK